MRGITTEIVLSQVEPAFDILRKCSQMAMLSRYRTRPHQFDTRNRIVV
jgi:hypothetical protein